MSLPVTSAQLTDFCNFAIAHAAQGDPSSVSELAARWEAEREIEQTVQQVRQSEREFAAGGGKPLAQSMAEIRQQLREQQQLSSQS